MRYWLLYYFVCFVLLDFRNVFGEVCSTNPPTQIQNSELVGVYLTTYTASDQIVRDSSTIASLNGLTKFSVSGWVKILTGAPGTEYSLFRMTGDQSTTTPTNNQAIRLSMFTVLSPSRAIKIQYSSTVTFSLTDSTAFAFTDNTWMFLFVSYDLTVGYIFYAAWLPNFVTEIKIQKNVAVGAGFHTAFPSSTKIELLYWGTYNKFYGHIDRVAYYPNYVIQNVNDWMIQALTDASLSEDLLLYLRLEASSSTQAITDFSGRTPRHDAVLGLTSSVDTSDPTILPNKQLGHTLQSGKIITISDHKWGDQDGFVVSFFVRFPSSQTISADADTTDATNDIVLLSKITGANIFKILSYGANYIKVIINNQVYSDTKSLTGSTWYQISISVALFVEAAQYFNYYVIKIDYSDQTTSGYKKIASSILWSESSLAGLTIGSTSNSFTNTIQISQLKVYSGLGVYYGSLSCISNCSTAMAKFGSISCLYCASSYYEQNGICYTACDSSTFGMKNSLIRGCGTCDPSCKYCVGDFSTSYTCSACTSGYYLLSGLCYLPGTGLCVAPYVTNSLTQQCTLCGNSLVTVGEECDDGNFNDYDGCTNCIIDPGYSCSGTICTLACGNGLIATNEECDDGNFIADDGCTNCIIDQGYTCTVASPSVCSLLCGNGIIDLNEECDDSNTTKGDGCTDCRVEIGYKCTVANPSVCSVLCGNSKRDTTEQCDDGNAIDNDGCTSCKIDSGYTCTGGSSNSIDVCTKNCPNGILEDAEECDDGNIASGDGCYLCAVESGFTCTTASPSVCTTIVPSCGNGLRDPSENCDDGINTVTSGCSPGTCVVLPGFKCEGGTITTADVCTSICGDGKRVGTEECDDGNILVGDGCDQNCKTETNYVCSGGSSLVKDTCTSLCGNGVRDTGEECDDENTNDGDGCSQYCTIEIGYSCTQIIVGGRDSCYQCAANCLTCTSKSIKDCSVCYPSYYRNTVTGSCDQTCSDGYYKDDSTQTCKQCFDTNCRKCNNGLASQCYGCKNDMSVAGGDCYNTCPNGYYQTMNPIVGKECTTCPFPCAECSTAKDCTKCSNFYYLDSSKICQLCNMDANCYVCDKQANTCLTCAIGYKPNGSSCEALPDNCGDGYYQPNSEKCDDGNQNDGDGCSSSCKIESNYACILHENTGPSDCYEKRATKVTAYKSEVQYETIYIVFERELSKKPSEFIQTDVPLTISGMKSREFNYTMTWRKPTKLKVRFNYSRTIQDTQVVIDFSKSTRKSIVDKYDYNLVGSQFVSFSTDLPYSIYYTDSEYSLGVAISWLFVSLAIVSIGPVIAYLYFFSQGRVFKQIEVIQVIGLFRFLNIRFDNISYQLFQQIDLVFNFRGWYSVFNWVSISEEDIDNFEEKDSYNLQRQNLTSSLLHNFLGVYIFIFLLLGFFQAVNLLLYRFIENDDVSQVTEKIKEFLEWDGYVKLFEFSFIFLVISVFIGIKSMSFETMLSIINFLLSAFLMVGIVGLTYFFMRKVVLYEKLHKRTDWFDKYLSIFDGLRFNVKKAKVYLIFPYALKFFYAGVLIFLHDLPMIQILACIFLRAVNIAVIFFLKPFHFPFIQRRDIASEALLIVMLVLCLNCLDDASSPVQKKVMGIILTFISFVFIFVYAGLYYWSVRQEDIYFDPIQIVPLRANPEDWMSQQAEDDKDSVQDPKQKPKGGVALQDFDNKSDVQDDFGITKKPEPVKPTSGFVGTNQDDDEVDIFAPKKPTIIQQKDEDEDDEEEEEEDDEDDDDDDQQNNFQR